MSMSTVYTNDAYWRDSNVTGYKDKKDGFIMNNLDNFIHQITIKRNDHIHKAYQCLQSLN